MRKKIPCVSRLFGLVCLLTATLTLATLPVLAAGPCKTSNPNVAMNPAASNVVQVADFNAYCISDVLWRNIPTNQNAMWLINKQINLTNPFLQTAPLAPAMSEWQIMGTGDFNGDGFADILWRNTSTGEVGIWFMDGAAFEDQGTGGYATVSYVPSDLNWQIVGDGDFNDDGMSDILWQNRATGWVGIWLMNGSTIASSNFVFQVTDLNWQVVGVGDFNNDGTSDIFWRNSSTGQNGVWLMKNAAIYLAGPSYQVTDLNWTVGGTGDFDKDGKSDIFWVNKQTGKIGVWYMDGTNYAAYSFITPDINLNWDMIRTGDYNGDGISDILWRNTSTGQNGIWIMPGGRAPTFTITSFTNSLYPIPDQNWQMH